MTKLGYVAIALLVAVGVVVALFALRGDPKPVPSTGKLPPENLPDDAQTGGRSALDPEQEARAALGALVKPEERIAFIRKWADGNEQARSNSALLRNSILADPDETVQIAAVEVALQLAVKEGGPSVANLVRTALKSSKGNTRARGLKAAREHPQVELVPELIGLVEARDAYAAMALNALAYTDEAAARAKVLAVAKDETVERQLRLRAVTLLAVTKDMESLDLLRDLANGSDKDFSSVAAAVLEEITK
jgi:hypothetical protein